MNQSGPSAEANLTFAAPCRASEAQFQQFIRGLAAVMNQWTALHLVAKHIDANAFQNLYEDLVCWHQRDGEVYSDEMEMFFEDFFGAARSVVIEDDSMKEVSDVLHDMYCRCCKDDFSRVEHFVGTEVIYRRENPVALCVNGGGGGGGDNEEELGGLTTAEGETAVAASDSNGLPCGDENTQRPQQQGGCNEEEEASAAPPPPRVGKNHHKKKNASTKGKDGWRTVL